MKNRYDVSDLPEGQFEPGSRKQVLKNLLGIRSKAGMDRAEETTLKQVTDSLLDTYSEDHRFKADDLRHMHKLWLGDIYPWAGQYRKVNLSKTGFMFSIAEHIPTLIKEFEETALKECTPCSPGAIDEVIRKLSKVHVEFVLIHPFREGNGRIARLLTTLMALQADLPLLDFRGIYGLSKAAYFSAIQAGMKRDYKPMESVIESVVQRTLRQS
jgi:cell filamentation protein